MATRFELLLEAHDADEARVRAAGEAALEEIEEADRRLSAHRSDSVTTYVNRRLSSGSGPVKVDDEFFELLELCDAVHQGSSGAFDAASGAWSNLRLDRTSRTASHAVRDVRTPSLDFGAIGKGFALDRAAEVLREAGIERAFLHGGTSTALAIGAPPGRDGFGLDVQRAEAEPVRVTLVDSALSVSACEQRAPDGHLRRHVFDPRATRDSDVRSPGAVAAVRAPSAALADAWSTAALVLGHLPEPAHRAGVELVLLDTPTSTSTPPLTANHPR